MTNEIFILILGVLCITDLLWRRIPNVIVLPAILIGCMMTGNCLAMGTMLYIGMAFYCDNVFCGGDVKLLAMVGSFIGWYALPTFMFSKVIIYMYRKIKKHDGPLPYAPYIGLASIPFVLL